MNITAGVTGTERRLTGETAVAAAVGAAQAGMIGGTDATAAGAVRAAVTRGVPRPPVQCPMLRMQARIEMVRPALAAAVPMTAEILRMTATKTLASHRGRTTKAKGVAATTMGALVGLTLRGARCLPCIHVILGAALARFTLSPTSPGCPSHRVLFGVAPQHQELGCRLLEVHPRQCPRGTMRHLSEGHGQ